MPHGRSLTAISGFHSAKAGRSDKPVIPPATVAIDPWRRTESSHKPGFHSAEGRSAGEAEATDPPSSKSRTITTRKPEPRSPYTPIRDPYQSEARQCAPNIETDDTLLQQAMQSSGAPTKKVVVDTALRLLVQTHSQTSIRQLRGKIQWQGDLNQSRLGRTRG